MAFSDALEFERAAEVRNQISALSRVLHQQTMEESSLSSRDRDVDILAVRVLGPTLLAWGTPWATVGLWVAFTGFMAVRALMLGRRARGDGWLVPGLAGPDA